MDELLIYVGDLCAGVLKRWEENRYTFIYGEDYSGPRVFLGWPLENSERRWDRFPPEFDGLLPEGQLLQQLLVTHKLDASDKWGQLIAVGRDTVGCLTILPSDSREEPKAKMPSREDAFRGSRIRPGEDALPYTVQDLVLFHSGHAPRMSISGVQPKVSAVYSRKRECFEVVETNGRYILKPSPQAFPRAAETEALTMRLAELAGLEVPACGLVHTSDGAGVYWVERFDRQGQGNLIRLRCEDACQLLGVPSSWKYSGSLESLAELTRKFCSNPALQLARLFERVLFCWITGNGDMHLKNWSMLERGLLITWSPAYDLLNTVILVKGEEESALTLDGRKDKFSRELLLDHLGRDHCELSDRMLEQIVSRQLNIDWERQISKSALPEELKKAYSQTVETRMSVLRTV